MDSVLAKQKGGERKGMRWDNFRSKGLAARGSRGRLGAMSRLAGN